MHKFTANSPIMFNDIYLESRPVLVEGFSNNVHVSDVELIVALAGARFSSVTDPLSNSLSSDLSPNGLWEPGPVLEDYEIYQGYNDRFTLKFPVQCQVYIF